MKSPKILNYEIRPCKFVERRLYLQSLYQITSSLKIKYQYIGFGGLTFTDFKLFHKELNIDEMYSIEGCFTPQKLEFNKPFSCINILHGRSSQKLLNINLRKPSIVWLDYDGELTMDVFKDINILFNDLLHGSIYIMTCNRQLQNNDVDPQCPYTNREFEAVFPGLVPFDIEDNCCAVVNTPKTIRKMVNSYCSKVLRERSRSGGDRLIFHPLYNIKYNERGAAGMYTYGGIILNEDFDEDNLYLNGFDFLNNEIPFEIDVPNITHKEALHLNKIINIEKEETDFIEQKIISPTDLEKYKRFYKYMPNFYDVRL